MYYLVSYDLGFATSEDYDKIDQAITEMNGEKILETTWIIYRKGTTAQAIANILSRKINEEDEDELVVVCFGNTLGRMRFAQIGLGSVLKVLKELKE